MTRSRLPLVPKVVSAGAIAILLLGAPLQLAAQESPQIRAAALEWFASTWSDLATWFDSVVDGRCAVDPNGCPGGS